MLLHENLLPAYKDKVFPEHKERLVLTDLEINSLDTDSGFAVRSVTTGGKLTLYMDYSKGSVAQGL